MYNFLLSREHAQYIRVEMVNTIILAGENCMFRKPLVRVSLRVRNIATNFRNEVLNGVTTTYVRRKSD